MLPCSPPLGDAALRRAGVWAIWYSRAVLCCAGAYVSGAVGSNACPAGSARIEAEAACRTAAAAAGKTPAYSFVETDAEFPRGCYHCTTDNYAFFNMHTVGAGQSGVQLLCAALDTTGAPLTPRFARVWTGRYSSAVCLIIIQMAQR